MRKAFIFLTAFTVSFMVIYSVYYYSHVNKLDSAVVANADDLHATRVGIAAEPQPGLNAVYSPVILQSLFHTIPNPVPARYFLSINAPYSRTLLENFDNELQAKFPNHPPIDFGAIKPGQQVLFGYYFRNLYLPSEFEISPVPLTIGGREIKALELRNNATTDTTREYVYADPAKKEFLVAINLQNGEEAVWISNAPVADIETISGFADRIMSGKTALHSIALQKNECLVLPRLDISIVKDYRVPEFENALKNPPFAIDKKRIDSILRSPHSYKVIQERVRFKQTVSTERSAPGESGFNTAIKYYMNLPGAFFIRKKGERPYFLVYYSNPELFPGLKAKKR